ncbi:hypothetical protein [Candidatus Hecatella orcuttiae]|jgi:hypothetical protein|uniref:hypothetical protein n=1 Tax=Candidatus Hecatella orcuttiae TaxID=1935119 RepID=UPI002867EBB2|nr:hypothetical protein [Candidatus Hecatella orcuttiae]
MSDSSGVNIQFTERALAFIKKSRLSNPSILVNLGFRSGGGGCGGSDASHSVPYLNTIMVEGGNPGEAFVRVDTPVGIPVYMAKPVFDIAKRNGNPLLMDVKGFVMKKLKLEGLDPSSLTGKSSRSGASCH